MAKKILTYGVFLGIAALFTFLAYKVLTKEGPIEETWAMLEKSNFFWVFLSMIMGYAAIVSRGIRWKYLLQPLGYHPKTWNSIHSVATAYLLNLLVPRSGEIARCTALHYTDKIPMDKLIGTVISERLIDFVFLFIFMMLAIGLNADAFSAFLENADIASLSDKKGLLFGLVAVLAVIIIVPIIFRKKIAQSKIGQKVKGFLKGVKDGILAVKDMKNKWAFIAHSIFIWSMYAAMAIVVFQSLEQTKDIGVSAGLFIMVAGGLGMVLPSPGGTGTYVFAVATAFGALGLSTQVGGAYGILVWIAQTIMMIIGGLIGLIMVMRARARVAKQTIEA